ncbi:hypothetical protein [Salsipaludibacter albus]|uniref:hypothetical protein n=1 Tax=Salsipaludibacter albus TaxID=2849650 RepID=UPI001EE420CE|nr:hypothetical protein [Salsipaludibacter albus]MBY5162806.1 hypothetical protein [Salsipaludibacter albus]
MDYVVRFFTSGSSLVGLAIVALVIADVAVTVLAVSSGPGPITRIVSRTSWRVFRGLHSRLQAHSLLRAAGPVIVVAIVMSWLLLMIVGWGLVFGQEGSLLEDGEALTPAWGRIHYAAALILGRGTGGFTPGSGVWRFAEQLAALTGVAFIGVAIAYVLPVINAVVHKRKVAATISALGGDPTEILERAYNGRDFGDLDLHLIALTPEIALVAQRHLAYPVVAYFHSDDRSTALAPSITVLDESLTLLEHVVDDPPALALERSAMAPCRATVTTFLRAVESMGIHVADSGGLPRPGVARLRSAGIPLRPNEEQEEAYAGEELANRRGLLAAFLRHDGAEPAELFTSLDAEDVEQPEREE